jgi:alanine-synthesizing transaminase
VRIQDLTLSNPTRADFDYPGEEIRESFARAAECRYDPHPRGLTEARQAIAGYYAEGTSGSGAHVDPARIHCTASSSEAYSMLFKLLCDPGDEICIPLPAYPLFSWLAALDAVTVRPYHLRLAPEGRWCIDMHSLDLAMNARTRAVIVVNPSNPAANYLRPEEFAQLDALCARSGAALIADEVFWDFPLIEYTAVGNGMEIADSAEASGIAFMRQRTAGISGQALRFTINGLSKLLALPQMKLGWILTEGPPRLRDDALARLDVIADSYLSVGTPVMAAAPALLALRERIQRQIRQRCRANLSAAREIFGDSPSGFELLEPEGGWSALIALPGDADEEAIALRLLDEHRVLVHPGYLFDFARGKYLVISLLAAEPEMREALGRMLLLMR